MGQPVIAVIEGDAREEGLELALACDIRIASDEAVLRHGAVAAGRLPAWGATQRLPRLAGRGAAAAMILLGEPLRASDAARCGLVNMISPRAEVRAAAHRLASVMASRGPLALRYAKEAMRHGLDMPLEQALRYETDLTVILQTTHDRREGVQAFLQKRPPRFSGR
jgi:enoyl-CoA hydratase